MFLNALNKSLALTSGTNNWTMSGTAGISRSGSAKNDIFYVTTAETVSGLGGDDVYELWAPGGKVVEAANGGNDTIYAKFWGGMVMPDHVENIVLGTVGASWATGNALDNLMIAGTTGAKLDGGKGNDVLVGGAGADIFTVQRGNGSDAIVNFTSGWDIIDLKSYGFSSFDQLKAKAAQSGKDVVFNLGGGEKLVLRDVKLSSLHAEDFNLPMSRVTADPGEITLAAWKAKNYNGWIVHTNAWGSFGLKEGVDFSMNGIFDAKDPTAGTTFQWSYAPSNANTATILAYPEIAFGHSPLDVAKSNINDTAKVLPVKVADMVRLTADYDVDYSGNLAGFNVAYDIWLSKDPTALGKDKVSNEVMVWIHKGAFEAFGKVVGTYKAGDATATIYHEGTYTALVFDRDLPEGTTDIAGILGKLQSLGIVSKDEYVRSVEFGAEVTGGQGKLVINNFDLTVETRNADGSTTTKLVDGTGTTVTKSGAAAPALDLTAMAADLFAGLKAQADDPILDDNGHRVGTRSVTTKADGSLSVTSKDLGGQITGTMTIKALATSVQMQAFDKAGVFVGAEQHEITATGATSISRFDADWKLKGADLVQTLSDGRVETQHFDAANKLVSSEQLYTETNGGVTTLHFDASFAFTGADTVYTKAETVQTYHYDAAWALTGRDVTYTNAATDTIKTSHYDAAGKLLGADQVRYYADKTTWSHFDSNNAMTDAKSVWMLANGVEKTIYFDGNFNQLRESYTGTAGKDSFTGTSRATDWHGGGGADTFKAGSGVDRFFLDTALVKGEFDTITNFAAKTDKIVLDQDIFSAFAKTGALDAGSFVLGKAAKDANDHILYDSKTGSLLYDADGLGGAAAVQIATLKVNGTLSAADFLIV